MRQLGTRSLVPRVPSSIPGLTHALAVTAVTSIATIGLYISYAVPIWCRLTVGRANFVPGPFFLGQKLSLFVHAVAICWVILICVSASLLRDL